MSEYTIQIEGLPEGYELTNRPLEVNRILGKNNTEGTMQVSATVFLKKSKQRRIVLEETEEERSVSYGDWYANEDGRVGQWLNKNYDSDCRYKIWQVNEE